MITAPLHYRLNQNYPNPFNNNTQIRYQIPEIGHVTLKVFNTLGQEVRTLVDMDQKAGHYAVSWDGRDAKGIEVSAGIYFCTLKAGEFSRTRKMVLLK
jgi:flagellar hook assembly protein FlgD